MSRQTIAVVDDDLQFLRLMDLVLSDAGYTVVCLSEAGPAETHIRETMPDLIILDVHMSGHEDGLMVLDRLRDDPMTAPIPVILCTADHSLVASDGERLRWPTCTVLLKPFQIDDAVDLVRNCLARTHNGDS